MNYAIVAQSVPSHLSGRVTTAFNLVAFLLAFLMQWGIGEAIGMWNIVDEKYPIVAYQYTIIGLMLLQLLGLSLWLALKPWKSSRGISQAQKA